MKTFKLTREIPTATLSSLGGEMLDRFCRGVLLGKLRLIRSGKIIITENFGARECLTIGDPQTPPELTAHMTINHVRAYSRMALGGSIGAGESYRDQDWDCPQDDQSLTNLIRIFVINRETLQEIENGLGSVVQPFQKLLHRMRKNSIEGAKKNIKAHYDIGNDFFELFLDPTWLYSSAIFKTPETSLYEASVEKIDRICRKLKLSPLDHVLEIGTGWGSFAIHAAKHYGCRVTTTTISDEQYAFTRARIQEENLEDQITLLSQDYRLLEGTFDKIVSIEMIESVGLDHIDTYFKKCSSLLKEDGQMMIQSITIQERFYESARKNVDFIQTHIFPGGGLPSIGSMSASLARHTDLRITELEDFGLHYARTLNQWSRNLKNNHQELLNRGYPEDLYRLWQFYFSYCEGGFLENSVGCVQMRLHKDRAKIDAPFTSSKAN